MKRKLKPLHEVLKISPNYTFDSKGTITFDFTKMTVCVHSSRLMFFGTEVEVAPSMYSNCLTIEDFTFHSSWFELPSEEEKSFLITDLYGSIQACKPYDIEDDESKGCPKRSFFKVDRDGFVYQTEDRPSSVILRDDYNE